MADRGRRGDAVFFIYDHNMLKKEEDDLKDAILFFTPDTYSFEDQCALCGQLMGISEFLKATLSKSAPSIFRFEHDKFALKRTGAYTFGLKGGSFTPDSLLNTQLTAVYETFITYHGSVDSLKLRCKESTSGFLQELSNIWTIILQESKVFQGYSLSQTFQALPYVQLPKSGAHLFLQASHLLQSSQRRPCVLAGTILYKNRVLCTQLPPKLTNHLTYLQNQIPHILRKTDCDLPVGCRIITVFLTDEELSEIAPLDSLARHHCKVTDFSVSRPSDETVKQSTKTSRQSKSVLKRRLTCPNLSVSRSVSQKALHSYLASGQRRSHLNQESVTVDNFSWSHNSKLSLSHVPIVECKNGEAATETDAETLYESAEQSHFGESYKQVVTTANCENEQSETDSESDDVIAPPRKDVRTIKENQTVRNAQSPVVEDIIQTKSEDPDELLKSKEHSSSTEKNLSEANDLSQCNTNKLTEMEGEQSDNINKSSEHIDLCNADNRDQDLVKGNSDAGQNENKKLTDNETEQQPKLSENKKHTEENPSISDLDEDTDEENEETVKVVKNQKKKSTLKNISDNTENIGTIVEQGIEEKESSVISSEASVEGIRETNPTGMTLSNSSSEVVTSRFYDRLSDTDTETLKKDSDHAVHQHTVDVHIQDSIDNAEGENVVDKEMRKTDKTEATSLLVGETSQDQNEDDRDVASGKTSVEHTSSKSLLEKSPPPNTSAVLKEDDSGNMTDNEEKQLSKCEKESSQLFDNSEDSKENVDPNTPFLRRMLSDSHRYESEIETEDEGVTIASIEPCINCIELASQKPGHSSTVRCSQCIEQFNKQRMFPRFGNDQEIIDFQDKGRERHESGTETEGLADERRGSGQAGSMFSSLSSDVSTDSTISRYWTHEMDGLNDVTLYVQCHSDISLLLLMENPEQYEESLFHCLWKGSLAYLADLDFYIKECTEAASDEDSDSVYKYLKYDMLASDLKGTIEDPGKDRKSNNLHQMLASLHTEFQQEECLSDAILRSHFNSCYGHSNHVEETYCQSDLQQKLSSGFPIPRDPVFNLDMFARQHLATEKHLSLL